MWIKGIYNIAYMVYGIQTSKLMRKSFLFAIISDRVTLCFFVSRRDTYLYVQMDTYI